MPGTWIQTYSGIAFDLQNPTPEMVEISDIAHHLSRTCRFAGAVDWYDVAHHSILVALSLPEELQAQGLLHDAAEAYVGDVTKPLKNCPGMEGYADVEARVWRVIAERFELPVELDPRVKKADLRMLATENRDITNRPNPKPWGLGVEPFENLSVQRWHMDYSRSRFLMVATRIGIVGAGEAWRAVA